MGNSTFDVDLTGWGSFNGTLGRVEPGYPASCDPAASSGAGALATYRTGSFFNLSDTAGGNAGTVASTVAGETYYAYAQIAAASSSTVGKTGRIILRERTPSGATVRESSTTFVFPDDWPPSYEAPPFVVKLATRGSGNSVGVRIEQQGGQPGDAFRVDNVFVRRAAATYGSTEPGSLWSVMSSDATRVSQSVTAEPYDRFVDRFRVYMDGKGGAAGTQKVKFVVYRGEQRYDTPLLEATSNEVSISAGSGARWVDFRFSAPLRLYEDGSEGTLSFGLHSGGTSRVARFASTPALAGTQFDRDLYADGPVPAFGPDRYSGVAGPYYKVSDKRISLYGVTAPYAPAYSNC